VARSRRSESDAPAPAGAAPAQPSVWQRFMAHSRPYRIGLVVWIGSIFLIPLSVLLHSPAATGVAIVLTWLAIHNFRRADLRERRALAQADEPEPEPKPEPESGAGRSAAT
jgi:hypothetical protein